MLTQWKESISEVLVFAVLHCSFLPQKTQPRQNLHELVHLSILTLNLTKVTFTVDEDDCEHYQSLLLLPMLKESRY